MRTLALNGLLTMLTLALLASDCAAQWMHTKGEDDPFAGGAQHMAGAAADTGELVMFRCTSAADLALLYISIEKPSQDVAHWAATMPIKLLVIVDDDAKLDFAAKVDTTPDGGRYRFTAAEDEAIGALVKRASSGKKRMAIAVELAGMRLYSFAVPLRGSKAAISALSEGCSLP